MGPCFLIPSAIYLRDVDTRPEQLQVLPHLARLVLGVEDGQLRKHAHVGPLQPQGCLHQCDELIEVAPVLVVVDQVCQFVCMDNDVQATDLGQTELLAIYTGEADLQEKGKCNISHFTILFSTLSIVVYKISVHNCFKHQLLCLHLILLPYSGNAMAGCG